MSELPQVPAPRCMHLQCKSMVVYGEGFEDDPDYQAGLTDFRNLLTSENQLLSARNAQVGAEAERASAFVRLTQALGTQHQRPF